MVRLCFKKNKNKQTKIGQVAVGSGVHTCCEVVFVPICTHLDMLDLSYVLQPLQPHVRVWDSVSLTTLHVIGLGTFERGVGCLDFSKAVSHSYYLK
jgi:hypothetical protein